MFKETPTRLGGVVNLLHVAECAALAAFGAMPAGQLRNELGEMHRYIRHLAFKIEQRQIALATPSTKKRRK